MHFKQLIHSILENDPCVGFRPEPEAEYSWLSYDEVYL